MLEREQPFGAGSDPSNIVDAPYPIGSIQVPGGVEPIILHRDAVSGGGYAMIATVISADMDAVAQSAPGAKTRFVAVDLEAALAARAERNRRLQSLREALALRRVAAALAATALHPAPLNVLFGAIPVPRLAELGVARVSTGSLLYRVALGAARDRGRRVERGSGSRRLRRPVLRVDVDAARRTSDDREDELAAHVARPRAAHARRRRPRARRWRRCAGAGRPPATSGVMCSPRS